MNDLVPQVKIADPGDKAYQNFLIYLTASPYADRSENFGKLIRQAVNNPEHNKASTDDFLIILRMVVDSAKRVGRAECNRSSLDGFYAGDDERLAKLVEAGLIVHDKKTDKIAFTERAVEFLFIITSNLDSESKQKTPFTLSQFRYVDRSVLSQDGKTSVHQK